MLSILIDMIEVHFEVEVAAIYRMFGRCMEVELNWPKHYVWPVLFVHDEISINMIDICPHSVANVFNSNFCILTVVGVESKQMKCFKDMSGICILFFLFFG